jgi:hypothetical protein
MPDRLEPMPCPGCGRPVMVTEVCPFEGCWRAMCVAHEVGDCWQGPTRTNRDDAIIEWDTMAVRSEQGRLHLAKGGSDAEA